ncbi:unnamed protein product [marine sediment metagenome]|uniref:Uncharacterized protein n=1 Tax=marine sediment metagenome TaxID=412755 RepID=X1VJF7_9ZZZZ
MVAEHSRRMRNPDSYISLWSVAIMGTLEWVLGDRQRLPDFE